MFQIGRLEAPDPVLRTDGSAHLMHHAMHRLPYARPLGGAVGLGFAAQRVNIVMEIAVAQMSETLIL